LCWRKSSGQVVVLDGAFWDAFLSSIASPALVGLAQYWEARARARPDGGLPGRADIDPLDFQGLLGQVFLLDVVGRPARDFRFRLFGTEMVQVYGQDLTGRLLSELDDRDYAAALRPDYVTTATSGLPSVRRGRLEWAKRDHISYERLLLPLAEDGRQVDMLLGATLYERPVPRWPPVTVLPRGRDSR
jgi:hypothetical protein